MPFFLTARRCLRACFLLTTLPDAFMLRYELALERLPRSGESSDTARGTRAGGVRRGAEMAIHATVERRGRPHEDR